MGKATFTTSEAAAELGVTPARVRQMVLDGQLEAGKFGRDLVITAEALEAVRQRKTKPGPAPKPKSAETTRGLNESFRQATERGVTKKKGRSR